MSALRVHGRTVRQDGREVATLSFGDRVVTIRQSLRALVAHNEAVSDTEDPVVGRLFRRGGRGEALYDAWTAMHEAAMTPSDRLLGEKLSLEDAIARVLGQAKAAV